jgi:cytidylate kinase
MGKQTIIAISREYGSGGHDIAQCISEKFGMPLYDRSLLREIAQEIDMDPEQLQMFDEKPRNFMLTRTVGKYTNSMEDILSQMQFDFIREKAESGESFVIVGRCAESVLRGYEGVISIFITGDKDYKVKRIMEERNLEEQKAYDRMLQIDKKRRQYHNRYSGHKWGDSRYYDMCINGSDLGVEGTAEVLEQYISARIRKIEETR